MFKFTIGKITISVESFDMAKMQFAVKVMMPLDDRVILMDVDINPNKNQQFKVTMELENGIPF